MNENGSCDDNMISFLAIIDLGLGKFSTDLTKLSTDSLFSYLTLFCVYGETSLNTFVILPVPWPLWRTADFRACGVANPSPLGAASSTHHGRCHMHLVWTKNRGEWLCHYKDNR